MTPSTGTTLSTSVSVYPRTSSVADDAEHHDEKREANPGWFSKSSRKKKGGRKSGGRVSKRPKKKPKKASKGCPPGQIKKKKFFGLGKDTCECQEAKVMNDYGDCAHVPQCHGPMKLNKILNKCEPKDDSDVHAVSSYVILPNLTQRL